MSRKKYVEKYEKMKKWRIKAMKILKNTTNDSSRTKRQSIIIKAKLKIIRKVWQKFYHQSVGYGKTWDYEIG